MEARRAQLAPDLRARALLRSDIAAQVSVMLHSARHPPQESPTRWADRRAYLLCECLQAQGSRSLVLPETESLRFPSRNGRVRAILARRDRKSTRLNSSHV